MKKIIISSLVGMLMSSALLRTEAQTVSEAPLQLSAWKGMVVAGYWDKGAFVNFGGPALNWTRKNFSLMLGMLPSLRFREDPAASTKNSFITPTLGAGLGLAYKHIGLQLPLYYTAKSASADGKWTPGIGLGYKF